MKKNECPLCSCIGINVMFDNVLNCTQEYIRNTIKYDEYYVCLNRDCDVVYFNDVRHINKEHVKVKFWFKNTENDYCVCYCHNIKFSDIVLATKQINKKRISVLDILKFYKIENIKCELKFPFDNNCFKLFTFVLWYSMKLKKVKEES